jgi:Arylsulfatase A and related enzymes
MKPNLIVIMADQLRADVLGKGYTPNIDALRTESTVFSSAYTACPLCVPSRGSFFTGLCPNRSGSLINPWEKLDAHYGDVKAGIDNLYTLFEGEFESIHFGKQHLFTEGGKLENRKDSKTFFTSTEATYRAFLKENNIPLPGGPAFKTVVPEMVDGGVTKISRYSTPETGIYDYAEKYFFDNYFLEKGLSAIKARKGNTPLFLSAMFVAPHPPYQIPRKWFELYKTDEIYFPEETGIWRDGQSPLQMYNVTGIIGSKYSAAKWKEAWHVYLGLVSQLDFLVGKLIETLKEEGLYENSLILFTSDHGEMLGSHALYQKMCMYEPSVKVPLSMRWPEGEARVKTVDSNVSLIDVLPTLTEYYGIWNPTIPDGRSLSALTKGVREEERTLFIQYDGNGSRSNFQRAVIRGRLKLIVDMFKDEIFYELYDVKTDPEEKDNLLFNSSYEATLNGLLVKLSRHMKESGDLLSSDFPPAFTVRKKYEPFVRKGDAK